MYMLLSCAQCIYGQEQAGLTALVFKQPLPKVPYRTQADDDLQPGLQVLYAGNGCLQQLLIFRRAVPAPLKAAARLLVAVDDHSPVGDKCVGGGCPEGDDEYLGLLQKGVRFCQLPVDNIQSCGAIRMGIPAVKIKMPPYVLYAEQLAGLVRLSVNNPLQHSCNGCRLVHNAERIDAYRKMIFCQVAAYMLDKAGAQAKAGRLVVEGEGINSPGYDRLQWYVCVFHRFVMPGQG